MVVSQSEILAQTAPTLILPNEIKGTVQLDISAFTSSGTENFSYEHLAIFVLDEEENYGPIPVQGRHTTQGDYLVFTPFLSFERGMVYVVRFKQIDTEVGHSYQSFLLEGPQMSDEAKVLGIYPSGNVLPENLLRFYIYFNTPMKKGQALNYIKLSDATGNIDSNAFMEFKQELWSPDGQRLTILFDPGRIKRGVSTNMKLGPALMEGDRFYLTISEKWPDVFGETLSKRTIKEIWVGAAYRRPIKILDWQINKPKVKNQEPLTIIFDRTMDHALLQSMIKIESGAKNAIAGQWKVQEQEHRVQFVPEEKWLPGSYKIIVDSRLEDVAGNNLQNLLDQIESGKENNTYSPQIIDFEL